MTRKEIKLERVPKPINVLRTLLKGHVVKMDGDNFELDADNCLFLVRKNDRGENVYLRYDMSLTQFIRTCNNIPDEDYFSLVSSLVMEDIKTKVGSDE